MLLTRFKGFSPYFGTRDLEALKVRAERERTAIQQATEACFTRRLDKLRPEFDKQITPEESGWDLLAILAKILQKQAPSPDQIVSKYLLQDLFPNHCSQVNKFLRSVSDTDDKNNDWPLRERVGLLYGYSFTDFGKWMLKQPQFLDVQG
jgi:hypothetical protein